MWEGLVFVIVTALVFKIDQGRRVCQNVRTFRRAKKEGQKYHNLTVATIALIEDAYIKS